MILNIVRVSHRIGAVLLEFAVSINIMMERVLALNQSPLVQLPVMDVKHAG